MVVFTPVNTVAVLVLHWYPHKIKYLLGVNSYVTEDWEETVPLVSQLIH